MGLDEAVLESAPAGVPVLRFFRWKERALTFGYSQSWAAAAAAAAERNIPVEQTVRRATGGGIVYHDGDLTFSLVFDWERLSSPGWIYKNIHRGIQQSFKEAGIRSALCAGRPQGAPGGLQAACFSGPEPMDLIGPDGRKVLGGALRRRGGKGLYQGSLRPEGLGPAEGSAVDLRAAVAAGIALEWGAPRLDLEDEWIEEGKRREEKYRTKKWNGKR